MTTPAKDSAAGPAAAPPRRATPRGMRRGALFLLAGLMFASALLRIADGQWDVVARRAFAAEAASDESVDPGDGCTADADIAALLEDIRAREAALDERAAAIEDRLAALRLADDEVARKLAELEQAEAELEETLALADGAAESDIDTLTAVYEAMKPAEAAALFGQMDPTFAAGFLARMRPDAAGAIMAGLEPPTAYAISLVLAGRNAAVPRE